MQIQKAEQRHELFCTGKFHPPSSRNLWCHQSMDGSTTRHDHSEHHSGHTPMAGTTQRGYLTSHQPPPPPPPTPFSSPVTLPPVPIYDGDAFAASGENVVHPGPLLFSSDVDTRDDVINRGISKPTSTTRSSEPSGRHRGLPASTQASLNSFTPYAPQITPPRSSGMKRPHSDVLAPQYPASRRLKQ